MAKEPGDPGIVAVFPARPGDDPPIGIVLMVDAVGIVVGEGETSGVRIFFRTDPTLIS